MNVRPMIALFAGLVFGVGLGVSQMINPEKVLSFLHISSQWDPSLALVMGAALAVSLAGYRLSIRRSKPVLDERFHLPESTTVDRRLIGGAAIFGAGWGLAGYCPGPAIAALSSGSWEPPLFVLAMLVGSALYDRLHLVIGEHP